MPTRETSRIVEIGERRWRLGKFDALTGSYIAVKLLSRLSSIVAGVASGQIKDQAVIAMTVANEIGSMPKDEFTEIQAESLHVVKEIIVVSDKEVDTPVHLPDGRWGVGEIEDDALLVMTLVTHVLVFNLVGFFDVDALKEAKDSFQGLIPLDVKI